MNKNTLIIVSMIVGVALIGGGVYLVASNTRPASRETMMLSQNAADGTANKDSMDYKMYNQLKGEEYDRTFMANMIVHHQGAVDMAKLVLTNAKHQELKDMAHAIISAQTKEITDMQTWQSNWGYEVTTESSMMDHSTMGMSGHMQMMSDELKDLTGDAFDKAFLTSMIAHHQSAIDMASPGQTNAAHEEVKQLTSAIVTAQSKEIMQMKQWQKDWGYER